MKRIFLIVSAIGLMAFSPQLATAHNESDLTINTKVSQVNWVGKKVTGQHTGTIIIKEGTIHLHDGHISGGKIIIDMSSITTTDLEGEMAAKLNGHLNSPDFFDVSNHPTATLTITGTKKVTGNKYTVTGTLTIKGITKAIEFPATIEIKDGKLGAFAELKIDRTLYDIKYGSGKFFEGLGDKMIQDEFIIKFKIAAE